MIATEYSVVRVKMSKDWRTGSDCTFQFLFLEHFFVFSGFFTSLPVGGPVVGEWVGLVGGEVEGSAGWVRLMFHQALHDQPTNSRDSPTTAKTIT